MYVTAFCPNFGPSYSLILKIKGLIKWIISARAEISARLTGLKFQPGFWKKSSWNQIVDYMERNSAGVFQTRLGFSAQPNGPENLRKSHISSRAEKWLDIRSDFVFRETKWLPIRWKEKRFQQNEGDKIAQMEFRWSIRTSTSMQKWLSMR